MLAIFPLVAPEHAIPYESVSVSAFQTRTAMRLLERPVVECFAIFRVRKDEEPAFVRHTIIVGNLDVVAQWSFEIVKNT